MDLFMLKFEMWYVNFRLDLCRTRGWERQGCSCISAAPPKLRCFWLTNPPTTGTSTEEMYRVARELDDEAHDDFRFFPLILSLER